MEIKDILYKSINKHSENIISEISRGKSFDVIRTVYNDCKVELDNFPLSKPEVFGAFAEGLVHYLLTQPLIQSQRKITYKNVYLDVVIPNLKTLSLFPNNTLVISFPKTNENKVLLSRFNEITKIQPIKNNIWFVLNKDLESDIKTYSINDNDTVHFSNIINDIISFFTNKKQSNLKLFGS